MGSCRTGKEHDTVTRGEGGGGRLRGRREDQLFKYLPCPPSFPSHTHTLFPLPEAADMHETVKRLAWAATILPPSLQITADENRDYTAVRTTSNP